MTKAEVVAIEQVEDGRKLRGHENRRRIVDAMLALIREGTMSPSAEEVATRAEVGLRTVFRHFDDMDSLYREISAKMRDELLPIAIAPFPDGDWQVRMAELIERRARVFEKMMPFKLAADIHRHRSVFLSNEHADLAKFLRDTLREVLGTRLARKGVQFEALDLLLSFDAWRRMRLDQGMSVSQAKKLLTHTTNVLLSND
jgi:AcrR family transcriptional regulator